MTPLVTPDVKQFLSKAEKNLQELRVKLSSARTRLQDSEYVTRLEAEVSTAWETNEQLKRALTNLSNAVALVLPRMPALTRKAEIELLERELKKAKELLK